MYPKIITTICLVLLSYLAEAQYSISSPDKTLKAEIISNNRLFYKVFKNEKVILEKSEINLFTNRTSEEAVSAITNTKASSEKRTIQPLWGIQERIQDEYNQLTLTLTEGLQLHFRAYNNGVAWRFATELDGEIIVNNEYAEFNLPEDATFYFPKVDDYCNPFECNYPAQKSEEIENGSLGITPFMYTTKAGHTVVLTEANLFQYPGMFLRKQEGNQLKADFPKYPTRESEQLLGRWRLLNIPQLSKMMVRETADYIAKSSAKRTFPWRVLIVGETEKDLLQQNLVYQLAEPHTKSIDFSWVKAGKVSWDWYSKWRLDGVDFKSGINTDFYKYMIDFAAENNLQYVNIDDGWSKLHNFKKINKDLDLKEVIRYAKQKDRGIFLWGTWQTLAEDMTQKLDDFQKMGIAGLKVDFFDRCDQRVVDFINALAEECAKRKLLLNLHGMYKPTGLQRTWPNVMNFEGVLGLEYNKFSDKCTPEHNLTIPFVRNAVGPMDYTPGSMNYVAQSEFEKSWALPQAMTTRTQQAAMYIVYHGGLQMLADAATDYKADPAMLDFLKNIPVSWDETKSLSAKIGKHAVVARRKNDVWYVGGICASENTDLELNLDFLTQSKCKLTLLEDGNTAEKLQQSQTEISSTEKLKVKMKKTGGFVAILQPLELTLKQ